MDGVFMLNCPAAIESRVLRKHTGGLPSLLLNREHLDDAGFTADAYEEESAAMAGFAGAALHGLGLVMETVQRLIEANAQAADALRVSDTEIAALQAALNREIGAAMPYLADIQTAFVADAHGSRMYDAGYQDAKREDARMLKGGAR